MPITYAVDPSARLIRASVVGDFTVEEMLACVTAAAAEVGEPGWHILADHRAVGEPATRAQVERLVDHLDVLRETFAGARWAVVVASPASYGMMRMFGMLAERVPMTVRVFDAHAAPAAERWARTGEDDAEGGARGSVARA